MILKKLSLTVLLLSVAHAAFAMQSSPIFAGNDTFKSQYSIEEITDAVRLKLQSGWFSYIFNPKTIFGLGVLGLSVWFCSTFTSPKDLRNAKEEIVKKTEAKLAEASSILGKKLQDVENSLKENGEDLKKITVEANTLRTDLDTNCQEYREMLSGHQGELIETKKQIGQIHKSAQGLFQQTGKGCFADSLKHAQVLVGSSWKKSIIDDVSALDKCVKTYDQKVSNKLDEFHRNEKKRSQEVLGLVKKLKE